MTKPTARDLLDMPGAVSAQVQGIDAGGQHVVGYWMDAAGVTHGFLATQVPEPASLALLLAGLGAVALRCRRQATAG